MWNRREVLSRILHARRAGVPITNFGMAIAWSLGVFERALAPFPDALEAYRRELTSGQSESAEVRPPKPEPIEGIPPDA
jgi:hypothetical protein